MTTQTSVNADLKVVSTKSQVVLVLLVLIASASYIIGFAFLWFDKVGSWVPILLGSIIFIFVFVAWFRAQNDTDLENARPTSLTDSNGNTVSTDVRSLKSPELIQILNKLFCVGANREPLPLPDGMVDKNGQPISNSSVEAGNIVNTANSEAMVLAQTIENAIGAKAPQVINIEEMMSQPYDKALVNCNKKI